MVYTFFHPHVLFQYRLLTAVYAAVVFYSDVIDVLFLPGYHSYIHK